MRHSCLVLALLAACGSPQPSGTHTTQPAPPSPADAAPPPTPFVQQRGCLPDDEPAAEPTDAGPETPPKVVPGSTLEALRTSGPSQIQPNPAEWRVLWRRHYRKSVVVFGRYCIDATGRVVTVRLLRDSGYQPFDERITREMSCWTFRPLVVDGTPTGACTTFTILFRPSPPSFAPAAP